MISPTACGVCQVHHVHQNTIFQKIFSTHTKTAKIHQVHDITIIPTIRKRHDTRKCLINGAYDVLKYTKYTIIAISVKIYTRARRKVYGKTPYGVFGVLKRTRTHGSAEGSQNTNKMVYLNFAPLWRRSN